MSKTPGFFNTVLLLAMTLAIAQTSTSTAADYLVPDGIAHRAGLTVQWNSQLQVGGPHKMADWFLHINEDESTTYFTLESGPLREVVSNRQLDANGEPFGMEGAKNEIAFRAEILEARYKLREIKDFEIKQSSYSLPKSVIYTLGTNGIVSAIDADTGVHFWDRAIDSRSRVVGLAASNEHVAVVLGSHVYCLNADDGRVLWDKATNYSPGSAPAVSDTHIFVPLSNGRLQSFEIASKGLLKNSFFASGFSSARPLVTPSGVAWVTDSGQMNFADPKTSDAVNFRLRASEGIVSSPTAKGNMIFAASLDGYVYGIDRDEGRLNWDVSVGNGISTSPVPIGDSIFVVSNARQLFKIDAKTGIFAEGWDAPIEGVSRFLGATRESIFALNKFNELIVINQKSARQTASIPVGEIAEVLTNYQSDRIYIASAEGRIQCVRDVSSPLPVFHASDFDTSEMADDGNEKKPADETDPFSDDADPFGGDADASDPFADGSDPFSSPAEDSGMDDSFGADDDDDNPFN